MTVSSSFSGALRGANLLDAVGEPVDGEGERDWRRTGAAVRMAATSFRSRCSVMEGLPSCFVADLVLSGTVCQVPELLGESS
jgi:hypothetical protein